MGWAKQGWDTGSAEKEADKQHASKGARRFWMPADTTKRILFLDDEPFEQSGVAA